MLAGVCPQLVIPQVQRLWHLILTVLADRGQGNDLPNHGNQGMGCPFFKQLRHETLRNSGNRLGPLLVSSPSFGAQDIHPGNTVCSSCVRDQDSQVEWTCQQHLKWCLMTSSKQSRHWHSVVKRLHGSTSQYKREKSTPTFYCSVHL